jgi:hypothetical protein
MTSKKIADTFHNSLSIVLSQLNKPEWEQPLEVLAGHFQQLPDVLDTPFEVELLNILWSLTVAAKEDADAPLSQMMAIRLSRVIAFTVRACHANETGAHEFWNPLTQPFSNFRNPSTQVLQAAGANPPEDVIKRWSRDHLK